MFQFDYDNREYDEEEKDVFEGIEVTFDDIEFEFEIAPIKIKVDNKGEKDKSLKVVELDSNDLLLPIDIKDAVIKEVNDFMVSKIPDKISCNDVPHIGVADMITGGTDKESGLVEQVKCSPLIYALIKSAYKNNSYVVERREVYRNKRDFSTVESRMQPLSELERGPGKYNIGCYCKVCAKDNCAKAIAVKPGDAYEGLKYPTKCYTHNNWDKLGLSNLTVSIVPVCMKCKKFITGDIANFGVIELGVLGLMTFLRTGIEENIPCLKMKPLFYVDKVVKLIFGLFCYLPHYRSIDELLIYVLDNHSYKTLDVVYDKRYTGGLLVVEIAKRPVVNREIIIIIAWKGSDGLQFISQCHLIDFPGVRLRSNSDESKNSEMTDY